MFRAMVDHGETLTWPAHWPANLIVDKHSTGKKCCFQFSLSFMPGLGSRASFACKPQGNQPFTILKIS